MDLKELSLLFVQRDVQSLYNETKRFKSLKADIDLWFKNYNKKFTDSQINKATYSDPIRKPYNEKFKEYEDLMLRSRMADYYLEQLS